MTIRKLYENGCSKAHVADLLGISEGTVRYARHAHAGGATRRPCGSGADRRRPEPILQPSQRRQLRHSGPGMRLAADASTPAAFSSALIRIGSRSPISAAASFIPPASCVI